MTLRKKYIKISDFNGVNVTKHWHVSGEVFAIPGFLVQICELLHEATIVRVTNKKRLGMIHSGNYLRIYSS